MKAKSKRILFYLLILLLSIVLIFQFYFSDDINAENQCIKIQQISTKDISNDFVHQLLINNGNCKFPVWWGITPGKTTWNEAQEFLNLFSIKNFSNKKDEYNLHTYYFYDEFQEVEFSVDFYTRDNIVEQIMVFPLFRNINNLSEKDFKHLSIFELFDINDEPSSVFIEETGLSYQQNILYITLIYENFSVSYFSEGIEKNNNDIFTVCLKENPFIVLSYTNRVKPINSFYGVFEYYPIDKATKYTINDFYGIKENENGKFCFEVNEDFLTFY